MSALVDYVYWKWDAVLSKEFCEAVLKHTAWENAERAGINDTGLPADPHIRVTDVTFQDEMQPISCITRTYMEAANQQAGWGFTLFSQENTQLSRYKGEDKGHYEWHLDVKPPENGAQRKLSCVILLNDPSEFEGGELQFRTFEGENMLTTQGSIIVFPSFIEHKVTPVTKGVRYTAVSWARGPSFR